MAALWGKEATGHAVPHHGHMCGEQPPLFNRNSTDSPIAGFPGPGVAHTSRAF
jgi:hypothetical protein